MPEKSYFNGTIAYYVETEEPNEEYARAHLTDEEFEQWQQGKFNFTQHHHYTDKMYLTDTQVARLYLDPEMTWWIRAETRPNVCVFNARSMAEVEFHILGIENTGVDWYVGYDSPDDPDDGVPAEPTGEEA